MLIIFQVCFFFSTKSVNLLVFLFCKLHIICILLMYLFVFKLFCYVLIVMKVCELTMNVGRLTFFHFFLVNIIVHLLNKINLHIIWSGLLCYLYFHFVSLNILMGIRTLGLFRFNISKQRSG